MKLRRLAPLLVLGALIFIPAALADSGTFSGSITGTTCGPKQPIQVAAGDTKIDVVASADVAPTTSRSSSSIRTATT